MSLVQVPWQPTLYVHQDMLAKLQEIRALLRRNPYLYGENSGWRSYGVQKEMWEKFLAGGNPASNPDSPSSPNTHMRGVASDLQDTSLQMQRACIQVGLQRDPAEAWHWQLSTWKNYPIIRELPQDTRTIDMPILVYRTDDKQTFAIGQEYVKHLTTPGQVELGRLILNPNGHLHQLQGQQFWDFIDVCGIPHNQVYLAPPLNSPVPPGHLWSSVKDVEVEVAFDDSKVLAAIAKVPTAEQNGLAARDAIVKP